jgi:hypothetical protein
MVKKFFMIFAVLLVVFAAFVPGRAVLAAKPTPAPAEEGAFVYHDHGKRDPFWALVNSSGALINYDKDLLASDMSLEGILIEPDGNNIAIINGTIVKANDNIGVFVVKKIENNIVTLQRGQEKVILKLKKEE